MYVMGGFLYEISIVEMTGEVFESTACEGASVFICDPWGSECPTRINQMNLMNLMRCALL